MNKYILATLILLVVIQGLDAQFLSGLVSLIFSVVGNVFNIVINVPRLIVNFAVAFTVVVSNVVFATLSFTNAGAHNALVRINHLTSNINNISEFYNSQLANRSNTGTFFGKLIVGNLKDSINGIGYTTSALASVVLGCAPPQPPPKSFLDEIYPLPEACLSTSTTNCSSTISCGARSFIALARFQINNINAAAQYIQDLFEDFGDNSTSVTVNATAIASLLDLWASLSASANAYLSVNNTNGSLLLYANGSFNENFTTAMNETADFLNNLINSTDYFINSTNILNLRFFNFGRLQRFANWNKIFHRRHRRWAFINAIIGYSTFNATVNSTLSALINVSNQFATSINGISASSFVYTAAQGQSSQFKNLINRLNSILKRFLDGFNVTINAVEGTKSDVVLNATASVNESVNAFLTLVLNQNISQCNNLTDPVSEILANFSLSIQTCGQSSDSQTQASNVNATDIFSILMGNVSTLMDSVNSCFSNACLNNLWYPFGSWGVQCANDNSFTTVCTGWKGIFPYLYNCASSKANSLISCLSNIGSSMNSLATSADSAINGTASALNSTISNVTSSLSTCVSSQVNVALSVLGNITTAYNNCVASLAG